MKKKIIKTWNKKKSEYDYSIKQRYDISIEKIEKYVGISDIDKFEELEKMLEFFYDKPSWAGYMPKQVANNIVSGRYEIIESDEEFTTEDLSARDIRNLAEYLIPKLEIILELLQTVKNSSSNSEKHIASSRAARNFNTIKNIKK